LARFVLSTSRSGAAQPAAPKELSMSGSQPALPMRDHTVLGVCEGLGEDFGFNPLYLRLIFAGLLIWQPVYDVGAYVGLGLLVMLSRLLVPSRRRTATEPRSADAPEARVGNDDASGAAEERHEMSIAA
jgi:phage shock protein PspC (stress-responsive transcriptional regulator)